MHQNYKKIAQIAKIRGETLASIEINQLLGAIIDNSLEFSVSCG